MNKELSLLLPTALLLLQACAPGIVGVADQVATQGGGVCFTPAQKDYYVGGQTWTTVQRGVCASKDYPSFP